MFLVWLINSLVKNGTSLRKAVEEVVLDYYNLEKYSSSEQPTGSHPMRSFLDLAHLRIITRCTREPNTCWTAGGRSYTLTPVDNLEQPINSAVPLYILQL